MASSSTNNNEKKKGSDDGDTKNGAQPEHTASLHELILNKRTGKYELIDQMSFWAKHLRRQEENRHLTQTEILELSMSEVLSGKVCGKEIEKLMAGESAKAKKKGVAQPPADK